MSILLVGFFIYIALPIFGVAAGISIFAVGICIGFFIGFFESIRNVNTEAKKAADKYNMKKYGIDTSCMTNKELGKVKPSVVFCFFLFVLAFCIFIVGIVCCIKEKQLRTGIICTALFILSMWSASSAGFVYYYRLRKKDAKNIKTLSM